MRVRGAAPEEAMTVLVVGQDSPTDTAVVFTVLGRAQPAGSKRAYVNPHTGRANIVDAAKGSRPWKQQVAGAALEHRNGGLLTGALELHLAFFVARPKGHYGTGRNAGVVKLSAPAFPTTKPDVTKLVRAVEDALTSVLWRDDAQIVRQLASKEYGDPERVEIRVLEAAE
jgi:Holliday junction resolvase RusA-like endonuclease